MAYTGQILENPVSGEKITFIRTAADTDGEVLEIELELSPDGAVPGAHVHPEEERFEVVEGTMAFSREVRAPFPPPAIVRATLAPLAWMATRRGYGERYAPGPAAVAV
jgi:hypothetical protein